MCLVIIIKKKRKINIAFVRNYGFETFECGKNTLSKKQKKLFPSLNAQSSKRNY